MRKSLALLAMCAFVASFTLIARADDPKETKIKGYAQCAKCALKETKECQNVVVVKDKDGKTTMYYLAANDVAKKAHQKLGFCSAAKGEGPQVAVEGKLETKDGKSVITATKIEEADSE